MHGNIQAKRAVSRTALAVVTLLVFVITANAYTIVMRGGRRVEVPSQFVLTPSTLTYEVSSGVQITLAVAAIDVAETEKANGEPAGSFMRRIVTKPTELPEPNSARTITNRDLAASAKRRQESEQAYEVRRKQLGLPAAAATETQSAREAVPVAIERQEARVSEAESERYWRQRAGELRTEMKAVDAELAFVRTRLADGWATSSSVWSSVSVSSVALGFPFGGFGRWPSRNFPGGFVFGGRSHRPNIFVAPRTSISRGFNLGVGARSQRASVHSQFGGHRHSGFGGRRHSFGGGSFSTFPSSAVVSGPILDYSYERSALITRFNELSGLQVSLRARWRELEDEARRAGAYPGWLRE